MVSGKMKELLDSVEQKVDTLLARNQLAQLQAELTQARAAAAHFERRAHKAEEMVEQADMALRVACAEADDLRKQLQARYDDEKVNFHTKRIISIQRQVDELEALTNQVATGLYDLTNDEEGKQ